MYESLEEILLNILAYQEENDVKHPDNDVHIIIQGNKKMILRVKDRSNERNHFDNREYKMIEGILTNPEIRLLKSVASEVKHSFIYGVNFITIKV